MKPPYAKSHINKNTLVLINELQRIFMFNLN